MAHLLNLCSSKAAEEVKVLQETFEDVIKELFKYFKQSKARTVELIQIQNILDSPECTLKEAFEVRWMAFYSALTAVFHSWKPLVSYFKKNTHTHKKTKQKKQQEMFLFV